MKVTVGNPHRLSNGLSNIVGHGKSSGQPNLEST